MKNYIHRCHMFKTFRHLVNIVTSKLNPYVLVLINLIVRLGVNLILSSLFVVKMSRVL